MLVVMHSFGICEANWLCMVLSLNVAPNSVIQLCASWSFRLYGWDAHVNNGLDSESLKWPRPNEDINLLLSELEM